MQRISKHIAANFCMQNWFWTNELWCTSWVESSCFVSYQTYSGFSTPTMQEYLELCERPSHFQNLINIDISRLQQRDRIMVGEFEIYGSWFVLNAQNLNDVDHMPSTIYFRTQLDSATVSSYSLALFFRQDVSWDCWIQLFGTATII